MTTKTWRILSFAVLLLASGGVSAQASQQQQTPAGAGAQLAPPPAVSTPAPATRTAAPNSPAAEAQAEKQARANPQPSQAGSTLPPSLYYLNGPYLITNGYYNPAYNTNAFYGYNGYNNNSVTTNPPLLPCEAPDPPLPCWPPQGQPHPPLPVP